MQQKRRSFSTQTMHQIRLQRVFDYNACTSIPSYHWLRVKRYLNGQRDYVSLGDIYDAFENGMDFDQIQDSFDGIKPKTILVARAFFRAVNPDAYYKRKLRVLKSMGDENIDEHQSMAGLQEVFGQGQHTTYFGLTGRPDSDVWATACDSGIQIIVTKDIAQKSSNTLWPNRDLTNCAEDAWKETLLANGGIIDNAIRALPIIIHIKDAQASGHQIKNMLRKHQYKIYELYDESVSPVIQLSEGFARRGIHYLEVYNGRVAKLAQKLQEIALMQLKSHWRLHEREDMNPEAIEQTYGLLKKLVRVTAEHEVAQHQTLEDKIAFLNGAIEDARDNPKPLLEKAHRDVIDREIEMATHKTMFNTPLPERLELYRDTGRPLSTAVTYIQPQ